MGFLISEPKSSTCTRLAEVTGISHYSANRFLHREDYQPKDMFDEAAQDLCLVGGTLSVDDSVLDKPYSHCVALVSHFWSGKHHRVVKGINLITLYYTDPAGRHMPVNFRICDKSEGKTKNDYFLEMLPKSCNPNFKRSNTGMKHDLLILVMLMSSKYSPFKRIHLA